MIKAVIKGFIYSVSFLLTTNCLAQTDFSEPWNSNISISGKTGIPLIIKRKVLDTKGNPVDNASLWIYHTDSEGFYAKGESGNEKGWRYADYSARLQSGPEGKFEIETIRPAGYLDSINPAHLHIRINAPGYPELEYTGYFEGGDRITAEVRNLVNKYGTIFLLPVENSVDGSQKVMWSIKLLKSSPY